jgi:NAD-dependent SIR2 family protein deacetylase
MQRLDDLVQTRFEELGRPPRMVVVTGAGLSAASGIPTYRDHEGTWVRSEPIKGHDFRHSERARKRYWARSLAGWPLFSRARPTRAHHLLSELQSLGVVSRIVTQNIDGLHQLAGSQDVVDLHGRLDRVRCLSCHEITSRAEHQRALEQRNPAFVTAVGTLLPDGDADIDSLGEGTFTVPECRACGGMLKPDVVFFGESVSRDLVEAISHDVRACDILLGVGTSFMVYSSFRYCRLADEAGVPIAIINVGRTRADDLAAVKVAVDCTVGLEQLARSFAALGRVSKSS